VRSGAAFSTRLEGQVKSISGERWLVDQTWVKQTSTTVLLEARGPAIVGAWVRAIGKQHPDVLVADTIEVLQPVGAPLPLYQFTGVLHKKGSPGWLVDKTPIVVTEDTNLIDHPSLNGLVRVTARRVENDLQAIEIAAIAPDPASVPFAIEGTVNLVSGRILLVDNQLVTVPREHNLAVHEGDTVEVSAALSPDGTFVAQRAEVVDGARDTALHGYVASIDGLGQENQTWKLIVFDGERVEAHSIKITADTYVDEDRALIEPNVEARVQGVKSGAMIVDAALVRLEQTVPAVAAGALTATNTDGLWRVGNQTVWFASDELRLEALSTAGVGQGPDLAAAPAQGATSARAITLTGIRLSSGILVAKEISAGDTAVTALAGSSLASGPDGAAGWYGPNDIVSTISQAGKPTVLFDAQGAGHAIFESAGKILYAYQAPGGRWGVPRKLGTGVAPTAVLDPHGRVNVAYASEFMGDWDILHVRMTDAGWSLPRVVAPTTGRSADPVIALDALSQVYIAWMDRTSGEWAIQLGTFDGSFWTSYPVPNARGQSPALAVMPDGALLLLWQDRIPLDTNLWGNYDIFASERKNTAWSIPVNVSDNRQYHPGANSLGARVSSTADGLAHLAWIDDQTQVRYDFGRGQYWPVPIDVGSPRLTAEGLSLRAAEDELLYLAWNEGAAIRVVASPPRTRDWPDSDAVTTGATSTNSRVADVFLTTGRGGVAVAWVQNHVSGTMGVYESRHKMGPGIFKSFLPLLVQP
jgi:hypothetical protein